MDRGYLLACRNRVGQINNAEHKEGSHAGNRHKYRRYYRAACFAPPIPGAAWAFAIIVVIVRGMVAVIVVVIVIIIIAARHAALCTVDVPSALYKIMPAFHTLCMPPRARCRIVLCRASRVMNHVTCLIILAMPARSLFVTFGCMGMDNTCFDAQSVTGSICLVANDGMRCAGIG